MRGVMLRTCCLFAAEIGRLECCVRRAVGGAACFTPWVSLGNLRKVRVLTAGYVFEVLVVEFLDAFCVVVHGYAFRLRGCA